MRNTSTDGDYLSLIAVWDCGTDGVETDLSLCLTHGASAAAIPTVQREAIEMRWHEYKKKEREKKGKQKSKKMYCIFKENRNLLHSFCQLLLSQHFECFKLVKSAQSLPLATLKSWWSQRKRKQRTFYHLQWFGDHRSISSVQFKTPQPVFWISYSNSSVLGLLFPVCSIRGHFGGEWCSLTVMRTEK